MRSSMLFLVILTLRSISFSQTDSGGLRPLPEGITIPSGTIIDVKLSSTIRSDTYKDGDVIAFEVVQTVIAGGIAVVDKGAFAKGRVVRVKRARTFGKGGDLFFTINEVTAVNGTRIPVQLSYRFKGINDHARTNSLIIITSIGIGVPTYGIAAPLALVYGLFRKGREAEQPTGKLFEVAVSESFGLGNGQLAASPKAPPVINERGAHKLPSIFDSRRVTINQILNASTLSELR